MGDRPHNKPFGNIGPAEIPASRPECEARVPDPAPVPVTCTVCATGSVRLVNNAEIYGRPYGDWPLTYRCRNPACGARVGVHPGTHIPLGRLADLATTRARTRAKHAFHDLVAKKFARNRAKAYAWLAHALGVHPRECHFGMFDEPTANRAHEVCCAELRRMEAITDYYSDRRGADNGV